ncbi:MAG: hypothetical protein MHM6MM_008616 [Cercozoa sp. M6MM]
MPLCFRMSSAWLRLPVRSLIRRCWGLMADALYQHADPFKLPSELVSRHLTLYSDALSYCLAELFHLSCNDRVAYRLLLCCRKLCNIMWAICQSENDTTPALSMIYKLSEIHHGRKRLVKNDKWHLIREVFHDFAVDVLSSQLRPNPIVQHCWRVVVLVLACLKRQAISEQDVPLAIVLFSQRLPPRRIPLAAGSNLFPAFSEIQQILSELYSRRLWYHAAHGLKPDFPSLPSLLLSEVGKYTEDWRRTTNFLSQRSTEIERKLEKAWQSARDQRTEAQNAQRDPATAIKPVSHVSVKFGHWSALLRIQIAGRSVWLAHETLSVHAWWRSETALLTCPFEYYRRNWLRQVHLISALPYDETKDNELSFLTELSSDMRCVATFLSKALIERCLVHKEAVTTDWCLRIVRRVVQSRNRSRTWLKLRLALKDCALKLRHAFKARVSSSVDFMIARSMATRHNVVARNGQDRPWQYANVEHALRCGVPVDAVNLMVSALKKVDPELYGDVMCPPPSELTYFTRPLATIVPLESMQDADRSLSVEPARLLCFLAWQHLHNHHVDLSSFFRFPITDCNFASSVYTASVFARTN